MRKRKTKKKNRSSKTTTNSKTNAQTTPRDPKKTIEEAQKAK